MARDEAYRHAERKIEDARRARALELDLSSTYNTKEANRLSELPESLGQLGQLQALNVSGNKLTALPESLGQLTQLQTLNVANNQLSALPESLGQLTRLKTLNILNNMATALPESLGQLTQLQTLDVSDNQLTALPKSLGELTRLMTLIIPKNKATALPESLGTLTRLQTLNVANNLLTSLPKALGQITQMQTLNVSNNALAALPESLGQLAQLKTLNVSSNKLTALPESLGQLTQLKTLNVSNNQLTALPESLGQLTQLQEIDLYPNPLASLPVSIGRLENIRRLDLSRKAIKFLPDTLGYLTQLYELNLIGNQLESLPESVGKLIHLRDLYLHDNQLTALPESICQLTQLRRLGIAGNRLESLPESIGKLGMLFWLDVDNNSLTKLPQSIEQLRSLEVCYTRNNRISSLPAAFARAETRFQLDGNPLIPELAAAHAQGPDAVRTYLREFAKGAQKRYEAKLLVLGDGNEGKTCVSRALRGLTFEQQRTTRGVDVEQWSFPHPDDPKNTECKITLNIWDFEGQEINHQTHQFFLTSDSLYLLVFKCRDQFLIDRAEYWLDTVRARAPNAKVAIVVTECEERTPYLPEDKLQSEYGDILLGEGWLFAVGCADNSGIPKLQESLKRWAADLQFMGRDWPKSYSQAEAKIKVYSQNATPHIRRTQLYKLFRECGIDETSYKDVATSLTTLGIITQFPDCPALTDFIVLEPQWLTKAISHIMEDKELSAAKGEITFRRMRQIWELQGYDELFPLFHDCMKEFELCYDLEDQSHCCMVPLRFGYKKPTIVWNDGPSIKERRVQYKLNIRPPMGLMSRFIVKTHHMIAKTDIATTGVYWHNGVFLRSGEGSLCSEALCEFDQGERTLSVQVKAAYPQNMIEQIHAYAKAVFAFFSGLEPVRSFGCIMVEEANTEMQCTGMHEEGLISFALESDEKIQCAKGRHHIDPMHVIWGISSFGSDIVHVLRRELDKRPKWAEPLIHDIGTMLDWADENQQTLHQLQVDQDRLAPEIRQQLELKLREYLGHISDMLDDRNQTAAPSLFSINTVTANAWNPMSYFKQRYVLIPYCECEGNVHRHVEGRTEFSKDKQWWDVSAPWIARGTKLLTVGLQLAFAGMPMAVGNVVFDVIKNDVAFMKELTRHMELRVNASSGDDKNVRQLSDGLIDESTKGLRSTGKGTAPMSASLSRLLNEIAPDNYRTRQWGKLRRIRMADNSYRWLCDDCVRRVKS